MLPVVDRKPLGNKKNNQIAFNIPSTVTTVADLIALLKAGIYGDVMSNNATTGDNIGVETVGTPLTKAIFESIEEGGAVANELEDLAVCSGSKALSAGWTWVAFPREFQFIPKVTATAIGSDISSVSVKDVTTLGFYAAISKPSMNASSLTVTTDSTKYVLTNPNYPGSPGYYVNIPIVTAVAASSSSLNITYLAGTISYIACLDTGINSEV